MSNYFEKIDIFVANKTGISRSLAKSLILKNLIKIDNVIISNTKLLIKNPNSKVEILQENPEIPILFQCEDFLIIYKTPGMSVCRTFNTPKSESVINEEIAKYHNLSKAQKAHEFGLPHRLDKDTSGLMILTKTERAYNSIIEQFNNKKVRKKYLAFVNLNFGNLKLEDLKIENFHFFICEHNFMNFTIYEKKCLCILDESFESLKINYKETKAKIVKSLENNSHSTFMETKIKIMDNYVECIPITGIRHQIRFSMLEINKEILGDKIYGSGKLKQHNQLLLFSVFVAFSINF